MCLVYLENIYLEKFDRVNVLSIRFSDIILIVLILNRIPAFLSPISKNQKKNISSKLVKRFENKDSKRHLPIKSWNIAKTKSNRVENF